jgi:hypothetical protein
MKKLYTLITLIATIATFAQAPQGFNYQATVRNSAGALIVNQNVYFKFNVMLNSATSVPVYSETHYVPTDDLGQVNLVVGTGTPTTGTFAGINWAIGSYYLGIELNTGSGYVAMGTTQLLSVPYALYANSAGSTQSQGKTSIYLTGNITNAQAAAKIAAEFGPYTENIYIKNTTQLTSVDLSVLVTISKIEIYNNSSLTNVNLNNLVTIEDEFNLYESSTITSLSFPSLLNCSSIQINSTTISSLNLPLLSSINNFSLGISYFGYTNNTMTSLNLPSVQTIGGYFNLTGLASLTSLTFPMLHTVSGSISIIIPSSMGPNYLTNLTTISFPALTSCTDFYCNSLQGSNTSGPGSIYIGSYTENTSINLSSLNTCNSIIIGTGANLNLSNLTSCQTLNISGLSNFTPPSNLTSCNNLSIQNMPNLTSLNLPSLSNCDSIYVGDNPLLTSVSFPALTSSYNLSLSYNALPTSKINSLLNKFLNVSPTVQKNIDLSNQNPLAPPTGQGLIDKQTLINTGNSVITD